MITVRLAIKPYLTQAARRTHPEKQATYHLPIREFMEKYGLEELLQEEETMMRRYQRWRAKR